MKDALQIASELRREALSLYQRASEIQTVAMMAEGRHYSLPDDVRATEEELLARMTPEQRKRYDEALESFQRRRSEG